MTTFLEHLRVSFSFIQTERRKPAFLTLVEADGEGPPRGQVEGPKTQRA